MKFDPKAMQSLLALDDEALWAKICTVASASGIQLARSTPPASEIAKIRAALGGCSQADVAGALDTIARFRQSK